MLFAKLFGHRIGSTEKKIKVESSNYEGEWMRIYIAMIGLNNRK